MFRMTVDKAKYLEKALSHYKGNRRCTGNKFIVPLMVENGIIMNAYYLSMYFEIRLEDTLGLLKKLQNTGKIQPVFSLDTKGMEYYLRGDIWDLYEEFMQVIRNKYPNNTRIVLRKTLVDIADVSCYYGISRTCITHNLLPKLRPKVIYTNNSRQKFYLYEDIIVLKDHPLFTKAVSDSQYNFSAYMLEQKSIDRIDSPKKYNVDYDEANDIFRDTTCSRYDACSNFAVKYTDYMDCSLCYHYLQKKKITPPEIFDPKVVFIKNNNRRIIKMLEKISNYPNNL